MSTLGTFLVAFLVSLSASASAVNQEYISYAMDTAQKWGVDPYLTVAVIAAESHFDPNLVSDRGAVGLMQLMPDTAARYGVRNAYDPEDNIQGGVRYLRYLSDLFRNDIDLIAAAYNAGEHNVIRHKGVPPFPETINYVQKVKRYRDLLEQNRGETVHIEGIEGLGETRKRTPTRHQ